MIGGVKIYDNDFHWIDFEKINYEGGESKHIYISDGVFIVAYNIICKGVVIGEKEIIGAGSVVTKSVLDGEIWVGNRAKFIEKI